VGDVRYYLNVGTSGSYSLRHREKFESTSKVASGRPSERLEEVSRRPLVFEQFTWCSHSRPNDPADMTHQEHLFAQVSGCKCVAVNGEVLMLAFGC